VSGEIISICKIDLLSEQENSKMISMLNAIAARVGADLPPDPHLKVLSEGTEPERLVRQIEEHQDQ